MKGFDFDNQHQRNETIKLIQTLHETNLAPKSNREIIFPTIFGRCFWLVIWGVQLLWKLDCIWELLMLTNSKLPICCSWHHRSMSNSVHIFGVQMSDSAKRPKAATSQDDTKTISKCRTYSHVHTHSIHVWYVYLHLPQKSTKCR